MTDEPKVYVVVLNYKQWMDSRDCVESLLSSTYANFSVLLVDNNSENNSIGNLTEWIKTSHSSIDHAILHREEFNQVGDFAILPKIVFIQNDRNEGFAEGNNLVLQFLKEQNAYVWLVNPDMIVAENTMRALVHCANKNSDNCIVGAEVRTYAGNHRLFFYGGGKVNFMSATVTMIKKREAISQLDYICGGCLFTHAANFKKIGLLPEEYFLYWEEADWCYRAKQMGYKFCICNEAVCYDKMSAIIGKGFLSDYYYARNGLIFISKYRKKNIPIVLIATVMRFFKRVFSGKWQRARGVFRGTIDFFKLKPDEI